MFTQVTELAIYVPPSGGGERGITPGTAAFLNLFAVALYVWAFVLFSLYRDPKAWWWRTQAKRFQEPERNEPSALEYSRIRARGWFGAGMCVATGVFLMVMVAHFD